MIFLGALGIFAGVGLIQSSLVQTIVFPISSWVVRYATAELVILVLYVSPRAKEAPLIELLVLVCT
jgi:hypothetical protein